MLEIWFEYAAVLLPLEKITWALTLVMALSSFTSTQLLSSSRSHCVTHVAEGRRLQWLRAKMVVKYNMYSWSVDCNICKCGSFVEVSPFISCLLSNFPCQSSSHVFPWPISGPVFTALPQKLQGLEVHWVHHLDGRTQPIHIDLRLAMHDASPMIAPLRFPFLQRFLGATGQQGKQHKHIIYTNQLENSQATHGFWHLSLYLLVENHPMPSIRFFLHSNVTMLWPFWEWCWLQTLCWNHWGYIFPWNSVQYMSWRSSNVWLRKYFPISQEANNSDLVFPPWRKGVVVSFKRPRWLLPTRDGMRFNIAHLDTFGPCSPPSPQCPRGCHRK